MKKWLLVLPWVVVVSTSFPGNQGEVVTYAKHQTSYQYPVACMGSGWHCEWVQDFVDAMNDAHEKRTRDPLTPVFNSAPYHSISVDSGK